jgi:Arc-like DNA binding dprotein
VAGEAYRFLLRMPQHLREQLTDASKRAGRSLNAELVHRLERSLEQEARAARRRAIWITKGERMRPRFSRRWLVAAGVLATTLAVAGVGAIMQGGASSAALPAAGESGPTALTRHLEALKQASPGSYNEEGPSSAADYEFAARAYPDTTISVSEMEGARDAFRNSSERGFRRGEEDGAWEPIGPSRALYPFERFRDSFLYVPNEYVAGGRTTAIALSEKCKPHHCRAWITPAGGGIWRTDDALDNHPDWEYQGGPLGMNSAGAVTIDPNDPSEKTVYVGSGEANICGSGCVAGSGLYKSTNGGRSWTRIGNTDFVGKGIGKIVVKPGDSNTLYVGTTTALRGMSSVCCAGVTRPVPGITKWGLYKTTNGGGSWSFIHNGSANAADCTGTLAEFNNTGTCSPRGVRDVELDPSNSNIIYAASYARGVWRSNDAGATWTQIKPSLNSAIIQTRPSIAVNTLPNGKTRMYVHEGHTNAGNQYSRLFRSDDVATGVPVFTDLTSNNRALPGYAWYNLCGAQCWYDLFVYTPKGYPDTVYAGGSYSYGQTVANKRAVVYSTDAGVSGTDMTMDGTDQDHPNALHPDQHDLVTIPGKPNQFIESNDGGVMRSSGSFVDRSSWCDDSRRGLDPVSNARCKQMLSRIPSKLDSMNDGLMTLQFQSLSVSPFNTHVVQGGTQDNGTWQTEGSRVTWKNKMIGDGGQSGFDAENSHFRFHTFTDTSPDVNFNDGAFEDWIWISDPIYGTSPFTQFYAPVISDPKMTKWMFAGTGNSVYRTKTHGFGTHSYDEMNQHCNEWTGDFSPTFTCGDWVKLGAVNLTDAAFGTRASGGVAAVERTIADSTTEWAATTVGRVFVTKNVDAEPGAAVVWNRIDTPTTPDRFISSIHIDSGNGNHAWISYSGYNVNTPATPGHVFEVTYAGGAATWVDRSYDLGDVPVTDLVRDDRNGDLYAATDFGVLRLAAGSTHWRLAARGMPNVEVAGLTIVQSKRKLFAATHGLSAWVLNLRDLDDHDNDHGHHD